MFLASVPVMLLILIVGPRLLPEYRDPDAGKLDLASAAISMAAVLSLIYGLKRMAQNGLVAEAIVAEFAPKLDAKELAAAKAAAAVMAMNNVYYRFLHLVENDEYGKLPAKLRMSAIGSHGINRADFELWCLAVSAINGCGMCIESHDKAVRKEGISAEQVQAAVRIAAVVNAAAAVLDAEAAVLIERRYERKRQDRERKRCRQREQHREPESPVEQLRILRVISVAVMLRERRQQDRTQRDAEKRARKLHQPIRVRDP